MKYLGNINRCGIPNLYMIANGKLGIITNFFFQEFWKKKKPCLN